MRKFTTNTILKALIIIFLPSYVWAAKKLPITSEQLKMIVPAFIALGILIVVLSIIMGRVNARKAKALYKKFAAWNGYQYSEKDNYGLINDISDFDLSMGNQERAFEIKNVLVRSNWGSAIYIFDVSSGRGKSKQKNTVFLFKLSKNYGFRLYIKAKLYSFLEKFVEMMLKSKNVYRVSTPNFKEFSKNFTIYSDNPDMAQKLIRVDVAEYMTYNKKYFKSLQWQCHFSGDKFLCAYAHKNLAGSFMKDTKLKEFVEKSTGLKEIIFSKGIS